MTIESKVLAAVEAGAQPVDVNELQETHTLGDLTLGQYCCDPEPHMTIKDLNVSYGDRVILNNVSLNIYRGCITALIGPSGCGKTSLLSSLNRMLDLTDNAQVNGRVELDGCDVMAAEMDVLALRRRVGLIFQRPNPFPLSIRKNLELPLKEHGVKCKKVRQQKIQQALTDVGLWEEVCHRLDDSALALSGGQQQRLCIARALVLEPEILLMDEPCSALDPISSGVVEDLIMTLRGRYTVVIVTHNLAQARRVANYAAFFWMKESVGKLIEFGRCHKVFEQPQDQLTAAYVSGMRG